MASIRKIGILTSGGDAPGMNAAIRSVVRAAKYYGIRVMGIKNGYEGLLHGDIFEMDARFVSETMQRGGTILKTARSKEFKESLPKYGAVYLSAIGGAAAQISESVKKCDVIAYEDLGAEAIHRLEVDNFYAIVTYDADGNDLFEQGIEKYKK